MRISDGTQLRMGTNAKQSRTSDRTVCLSVATTVFADPRSITISDPDHSSVETRFLDIG